MNKQTSKQTKQTPQLGGALFATGQPSEFALKALAGPSYMDDHGRQSEYEVAR